jgi:serine/threonine-protein kinase
MTPERWKQVNELFESALAREPGERAAFLAEACRDEAALRDEVDSLLAAHHQAGSFMEEPALAAMPERSAPTLEPGARLGPYNVVALIGSGGMGEVYRARDPRLGREVAIKVLSPRTGGGDPTLRLDREARAVAALNHPNILAVYDVGVADRVPYVVSELLEGETLRARLRSGPLPWPAGVDLGRQAASGLAAAHDKGIVHRDLKPENLFLTRDGRLKILDFGLARQVVTPANPTDTPTTPLLTQPGTVLGTVGYMAPEQVRGRAVDARSDVFSFGAVLYEMLSGRRAFTGGSSVETMNAILTEEPPSLSGGEVPAGLERIVLRCLGKEPDARFSSARDLAAALDAFANAGSAQQTAHAPASAAPTGPERSIAVLPFLNMTGDGEQEYFCEGMAEELINALAKIEGLRVAARTSAFRFKAKGDSVERIGRELRVEKILEGSVRRAGNRLRIAVQLVNAADGYHVWSERYDRDVQDVFALQDELVSQVVEVLRVRLDPHSSRARRYTDDLEAYHLYLKGVYFWNKRHKGGLLQGVKAFEAAIARDPLYAPAYSGLADSYGILGLSLFDVMPPREAMPRAKAAATKALEIDSGLAAPHAALGWVRLHYDWDWTAAAADFRRSIDLDPTRATTRHWHSFYLSALGRVDEAVAQARRAWELDPLSLIVNANLFQPHYYARRFEEAAAGARRLTEMDPDFAVGHFFVGIAEAGRGRYAEAIAAYEAFAAHGGGASRALALVGNARARANDRAGAMRALDELAALATRRYVPAYHFALVHIGLGQRDEALASLERAYEERSDQLAYLAVEPLLDPVRSDRRFQALQRRLGLPLVVDAVEPTVVSPTKIRGGRRAVAVLPFRDLAGDPESAHLGLSLADATITELARLHSLLVRPTSAILCYEGADVEPSQAGRELAVDAVVDARFQRAGSRLRVTVQLVDAAEGRPLWAGKIDASLDDVFAMQDEVARNIARALEVELTPTDERRLAEGARAPGPTAATYELYMRGKRHLFGESLSDFVSAIDWFEKAREADPGFALAWAGLADAYARLAFSEQPEGNWYARAKAMCEKALALDPRLPEARYVRARLHWTPQSGFDHAAAIRDVSSALRARPNLEEGYVLLGNVMHHVGLTEQARTLFERAEAVSPRHPRARSHIVMCLVVLGRYQEALDLSDLPRHSYSFVEYLLALCQIHLGRLDEAEDALAEMAGRFPGDELVVPLRGLLAASRGDAPEADRQILITERDGARYGHYHHLQYDVACIHSLLGRPEKAVDWLTEAARNGYPCASHIERDEFLDPLRGTEGFARLVSELRTGSERYARLYAELQEAREEGP